MGAATTPDLHLETLHEAPEGWPLRLMRIPEAHRITRGNADILVAVIDLGYRPHPHHEGHLWVNPRPTRDDVHGWDFHDDDATLEYNRHNPETPYNAGHHAFVVGQVIACAPCCPVMVLRVGYGNRDSWWRAIDYAREHGARVLVMPHGYITEAHGGTPSLFERGTDFNYPIDNPQLRRAIEDAYDAGCLIVCGAADNRGRRAAIVVAAWESMMAVGSANRHGRAADVCASSDYVEAAAPCGDRNTSDLCDRVWCTGGHGTYVPMTGGCMAAGFAGGVTALAWSQHPHLSNDQLRCVLRNTAAGDDWNPRLGYGVLDACRAVSLDPAELTQRLHLPEQTCDLHESTLTMRIANRGAIDVKRAMVVLYNGDPRLPAAPDGTEIKPKILVTRQVGHAIVPLRGLHDAIVRVELAEPVTGPLWAQVCTLDHRGTDAMETIRLHVAGACS